MPASAISFVTSNDNKFREAESILKEFGVNIAHVRISYPEIRNDGVEEVSADSARHLSKELGPSFFVEDTGLFIEALNGFPGAYSAWALKKIGMAGILKLLEGEANRRAVFKTAVALYDGELHVFTGESKGSIALGPKGKSGFGYDPIFVPEGYSQSFAELDISVKNRLSHRRRALEEMVKFIKKRV